MPKRTDIKSILIIGAGPIVIGQACEFDYSGAQACKALREEGYRVILVNSNPATIMTDPEMADVTYIEPITWQMVEKIIAADWRIRRLRGSEKFLHEVRAAAEDGRRESCKEAPARIGPIEEAGDLVGARQTLSHCLPDLGGMDRRTEEWFDLWRRCQPD
jgi:hypothetical protein